MKFPSYEFYEEPKESLVSAYIRFYGEHERDHRQVIDGTTGINVPYLKRAHMHIGWGCLKLAKGDKAAGRTSLNHAGAPLKQALEALSNTSSQELTHARTTQHLLTMLKLRNQAAKVEAERHAMQQIVIDRLGKLIPATISRMRQEDRRRAQGKELDFASVTQARIGFINELTMQGLLNRYQHPWLMAMPALTHHDATVSEERSQNYDSLLVESFPKSVDERHRINFTKLQIKNRCIGICNQPTRRELPQEEYDQSIVLVSGHCDLGYRSYEPASRFRIGQLLCREASGEATTDQIALLDQTTNDLLFGITGDPRRHGSLTI